MIIIKTYPSCLYPVAAAIGSGETVLNTFDKDLKQLEAKIEEAKKSLEEGEKEMQAGFQKANQAKHDLIKWYGRHKEMIEAKMKYNESLKMAEPKVFVVKNGMGRGQKLAEVLKRRAHEMN
jgi:DNA repair ATPase RecN